MVVAQIVVASNRWLWRDPRSGDSSTAAASSPRNPASA